MQTYGKMLTLYQGDSLGPKDRLSVILFNHHAGVLYPLQYPESKEKLENTITAIKASGGTSIQAGLDVSLAHLRGIKTAVWSNDYNDDWANVNVALQPNKQQRKQKKRNKKKNNKLKGAESNKQETKQIEEDEEEAEDDGDEEEQEEEVEETNSDKKDSRMALILLLSDGQGHVDFPSVSTEVLKLSDRQVRAVL